MPLWQRQGAGHAFGLPDPILSTASDLYARPALVAKYPIAAHARQFRMPMSLRRAVKAAVEQKERVAISSLILSSAPAVRIRAAARETRSNKCGRASAGDVSSINPADSATGSRTIACVWVYAENKSKASSSRVSPNASHGVTWMPFHFAPAGPGRRPAQQISTAPIRRVG